jgi:hypothetical protein
VSRRLARCAPVALLLACGGSAAPTAVATPAVVAPEPARDWALQLAAQLPDGADRCDIARPSLLNDEQRALYGPVAHSVVAWRESLRVVGYARVERDPSPGGWPLDVTFVRVEAAEARVREALAEATGLALAWDQDAAECGPNGCPTSVRFVEPDLVRLARGTWPEAPAGKGVAPRCRALAERHPEAIELWARRTRELPREGETSVPLRTASKVLRRAQGVRFERKDLMASTTAAEEAAATQRAASSPGTAFGVPGVMTDVRREGTVVTARLDVLWEDLRFARDDRGRMAEAERYAAALERVEPEEHIPWSSVGHVAAQIDARIKLLELARAPDAELLAATRALLDRALAAYPDDPTLADLRERFARLGTERPK